MLDSTVNKGLPLVWVPETRPGTFYKFYMKPGPAKSALTSTSGYRRYRTALNEMRLWVVTWDGWHQLWELTAEQAAMPSGYDPGPMPPTPSGGYYASRPYYTDRDAFVKEQWIEELTAKIRRQLKEFTEGWVLSNVVKPYW